MAPAVLMEEIFSNAASESKEKVLEKASKIASMLMFRWPMRGSELKSYIKKSFRNGTWRSLSLVERAMLLTSSFFNREMKSSVLRDILFRILLKIEMGGTRGSAIFYGVAVMIGRGIEKINVLKKMIERVLFAGLSYLNSPIMMRHLG